jgi:DMSO/TMAO reductase YedYZ molybdopterin-dependent catalytic subunit
VEVNTKLKRCGREIALLIAAIGIVAMGAAAQTAGGQAAPPMQPAPAATATATPIGTLSVTGEVTTELHLSAADLKALPRTTLTAMDAHEKQTHVFEGVTLAELLKRAGLPTGENLRGKSMALCVLATAADGYHAVFSLAELDASIGGETVLVADTVDGQPIPTGQGPLRLVVPSDKRPARWVRMVQSLTVISVSAGK